MSKHPRFTKDVREASKSIRKTGHAPVGKYSKRVEKRAYKKTGPYVNRQVRRQLRRGGRRRSDTFQRGFDAVTPITNKYTRDNLDAQGLPGSNFVSRKPAPKKHPAFTRMVREGVALGRKYHVKHVEYNGGREAGKLFRRVERRVDRKLHKPARKPNRSSGKTAFNTGRQFSPARSEDSIGYYDSKTRGNKRGRSFVTDSRGRTTHTRKRRPHNTGKAAFNAGRRFSPAKYEDSPGYWNAKTRGNKRGRSLINDNRGKTHYLPKRRPHKSGKAAFNAGKSFVPKPAHKRAAAKKIKQHRSTSKVRAV